jgi:lactoylglutathione lyase
MTTEYRTLAPGVHDKTSDPPVTDANLKTVRMNHACFHITNPDRSLAFFKNVLGYSTLFTWNIGPQTVFFLGHKQEGSSQEYFLSQMQKTQGLIELLWLHSDEQNEGPATPKSHERPGFFHIGL